MGKKGRIPTNEGSELRSNPFAGLSDALDRVPQGEGLQPEAAVPEDSGPNAGGVYDGKIVVRREKKGRGGKTATAIEGLRGEAAQLDVLARRLRKDLGCGASVEGSRIVIQGAQTERVRAWLQRDGAARVIVGN